jgi:hypothetical protein
MTRQSLKRKVNTLGAALLWLFTAIIVALVLTLVVSGAMGVLMEPFK